MGLSDMFGDAAERFGNTFVHAKKVPNKNVTAPGSRTIKGPSPASSAKFDKSGTLNVDRNKPMEQEIDVAPMAGFEIDNLLKALELETDKGIQKKEKTLRDIIDQQAAILGNTRHQLDMTPLAALVDARTGSNFASSYKKPASAKNNLALVQKLDEAAKAQKQDIIADKQKLAGIALKTKMETEKNRQTLAYRLSQMLTMGGNHQLANKLKGKEVDRKFMDSMTSHDKTYRTGKELLEMAKNTPEIFHPGAAITTGDWATWALRKVGSKGYEKLLQKRAMFKASVLEYTKKYATNMEKRLTDKDFTTYQAIIGDESVPYEDFINMMNALRKRALIDQNIEFQNERKGGRPTGDFKMQTTEEADKQADASTSYIEPKKEDKPLKEEDMSMAARRKSDKAAFERASKAKK